MQGYGVVKKVEGRLFAGKVLWRDGHLYVTSPPVLVEYKFDFRSLWFPARWRLDGLEAPVVW